MRLRSEAKNCATFLPPPTNLLYVVLSAFDERRGRGDRGNPNLDPEMDIKLNREFYAQNDVRPPYTYAALIRYVSTGYLTRFFFGGGGAQNESGGMPY